MIINLFLKNQNFKIIKNSKAVFDLTLQTLHYNLNCTIPLSTLIFFVRSILSVMEILWAPFQSQLHHPGLLSIIISFSGRVIKGTVMQIR